AYTNGPQRRSGGRRECWRPDRRGSDENSRGLFLCASEASSLDGAEMAPIEISYKLTGFFKKSQPFMEATMRMKYRVKASFLLSYRGSIQSSRWPWGTPYRASFLVAS